MQPNLFKESRMASIEVLFEFFKAVPKDYYSSSKKVVNGISVSTYKYSNITLSKELDLKTNGFDVIEITGKYLNPQDQKVFRAILELLYKQEEKNFEKNSIEAKSLNNEYIEEDVSSSLFSNYMNIKITQFYKVLNPSSKKSTEDSYSKVINSLQKLAQTSLSFYTNNKEKILTAPLLIFEKDEKLISFQLHPCLLSYRFESKNNSCLIPLEQSFYSLNNKNFFNKNISDIEQLIYSNIQYKFASMSKKYKSFSITLNELQQCLFLESNNNRTIDNQRSKILKAIKSLDNKFEYKIERHDSRGSISFDISKI